jgi:WD40 repeat protein
MAGKNYLNELKAGLLSVANPNKESDGSLFANLKLPKKPKNLMRSEVTQDEGVSPADFDEKGVMGLFKMSIREINPKKISLPYQSAFLVKMLKVQEIGIFVTYTTGVEPVIVKYCFKTGTELMGKDWAIKDYTKLLVSPDEKFLLICKEYSLHIMDLATLEVTSSWEFADQILKASISCSSRSIHVFTSRNSLYCLCLKTHQLTEIAKFEDYTMKSLLRNYCMLYRNNTLYQYNLISRSFSNSIEISENIESISIHSNFKNTICLIYDPVQNTSTIHSLHSLDVLNHYHIDERISKVVFARNDQTAIVLYETGKLAFFSVRMYDKPAAFRPYIKIFRKFFHFNQLTNEFYSNDELFDTYRWKYLENKVTALLKQPISTLRPVHDKIYELVENQMRIIDSHTQEQESTIPLIDATRFEYKRNSYESYILLYHGTHGISIRDPKTLTQRCYFSTKGDISDAILLPGTQTLACVEGSTLRFYNSVSGTLEHIITSAHILDISYMITSNSGILITCSHDKTVRLWDYKDSVPSCINKLVYEDLEFTCLGLDRSGEYFLAGSVQGKVVLWNLYSKLVAKVFEFRSEIVKISISRNGRYFFIGERSGFINIGYLPTLTLITAIEMDMELNHFFLDDEEKFIYTFSDDASKRYKNPLNANSATIYGPVDGKSRYYSVLYDLCIQGRDMPHDPEFDKLLFSPGGINSLHIYTYFGMAKHLKKCLRESMLIIPDRNGLTPIDMCLQIKDTELLGIFLNGLIRQIPKNKHLANVLENCIIQINKTGHPILDDLYRVMFRTCLDNGIPRFCDDSLNLPIRVYSKSKSIRLEDFSSTNSFETKKQMICFKETLIPLNYNFGSQESIEFLRSIYECSNEEIFRTPLIQEYLKFKWITARNFMAMQGFIYTVYVISILKHLLYKDDDFDVWFIFIMNCIIITFELFQMVTNKWEYLQDAWNYLDMVRNILCTLYIYDISFNHSYYKYSILELLILVSMVRGIAYFRLFADTRYLINLLSEVVKDIRAFMALLVYAIFTNLVLVYIFSLKTADPDFGWGKGLMKTYNMLFGDMEQPQDFVQWVTLTMNMLIIPIIILNLLISILGDTYDRVQNGSTIADMKEILEMIIEVEQLFFWRKDLKGKAYFQICMEKEMLEINENAWEGRIRQMDKKMNLMKHTLNSIQSMLKQKQAAQSQLMARLSDKVLSQEAMFKLLTESGSVGDNPQLVEDYRDKLIRRVSNFRISQPSLTPSEAKSEISDESGLNTQRTNS